MNHRRSENPYASPQAAPKRFSSKQLKAQAWLNGAGLALMLLGLAHLFLSPMILFAGILGLTRAVQGPLERGEEEFVVTAIFFVVVSVPCFIRAVIMFLGGIHIRSKQRYRWAMASAIATVCGILFPFLWLDVPFGIWAFILLRKEKNRALFEFIPAPKSPAIPIATVAETL